MLREGHEDSPMTPTPVPHQSERAETPRTDEALGSLRDKDCGDLSCDSYGHDEMCPYANPENVMAEFARQLERELVAERAARKEAQEKLRDDAEYNDPYIGRLEHENRTLLADLTTTLQALKEAQRELQQVHQASASTVASSPDVGTDAAADAQDEVVGHKTFSDGHGGFRHEPLKRTEAEAIMALCDAQQAARTARYPTAEDAVRGMCDAHHRLRELGWREAIYAPPDGKLKRVVEAGSSGIHEAYCERRPEGSKGPNWWWSPSEGDLWPVTPILYFPDELPRTVRATVALMSEDYAQKTGFGQDKPSSPPPSLNLQTAVEEAQREAFARAAVVAESMRGGFTANVRVSADEPELVRDPDGPWVLNSDVAAAIRALIQDTPQESK
jgi:hypothetical protein